MVDIPELWANNVPITRGEFITQLEKYLGMTYDPGASHVWADADGKLLGAVNCYGLILDALNRLGVTNVDINLDPQKYGQSVAQSLRQLLRQNCTEVTREEARAGDILLMCYRDADPRNNEPHHVAVAYWGNNILAVMIHAAATQESGAGTVHKARVDARVYQRIEEVWRLNNFTD